MHNGNPEDRDVVFIPESDLSYLREQVTKNDLVPFIGAGISMGAKLQDGKKMPGYKELLYRLLESCKDKLSPSIYSECEDHLSNNDYMIVADLIDHNLNSGDLYLLLREQLNRLQPRPSIVHELLNIFDFEIVLTSNYDRMLETSLFPTPEVVTYQDSVSLSVLSRERTPFIFKIHGDLTRPETIVLGWSRYEKLQGNDHSLEYSNALRTFVDSILLNKTLLFLGCSFADSEYAQYFFQFAKDFKVTGKHYALIEKGAVSKRVQKTWYDQMGLKMLEFVPDKDYSQIPEFLASLKAQNRQPETISGATFENFYLLQERPDYLKQQLDLEQKSVSCRYITPGITNCLADYGHIERNCEIKLKRFQSILNNEFKSFKSATMKYMLERARNIEERLENEEFEFRSVFLLEEVEEEMKNGAFITKARYDHIFKLIDKHHGRVQLRAYAGDISRRDYLKSTYALVFYGRPSADIAYFYASQANTNKFSTHMLQINTRAVMERVEHFERFWVNSLSEEATVKKLKSLYNQFFIGQG